MKVLIVILLNLSTTALSYAQQSELAIARINYAFSHVRDTNQRDRPYKENMRLIIGKNASLYISEDRINQIERTTEFIKQQTIANGGTLSNVVMQKGMLRAVSLTDLYFFANERKMVTIENMREKFRIDEEASPIQWKITKDTTSFSGISCQKATANFKGRKWVAWFAPSLPFVSGPWKLNGLPGLIIEAYDERKDIQFIFSGFTKVSDTMTVKKNEVLVIGTASISTDRDPYTGKEIKIPTNTVKTTRDELNRLKGALADNPAAGLNSFSGGTTTLKRVSGPSAPQSAIKSRFNNPIELPEQTIKQP